MLVLVVFFYFISILVIYKFSLLLKFAYADLPSSYYVVVLTVKTINKNRYLTFTCPKSLLKLNGD